MLEYFRRMREQKAFSKAEKTMTSLYISASEHSFRNQYDNAHRQYQALVELQTKVLGEKHHRTLQSISSQAQNLMYARRYDDAQCLFQRVLEGETENFGAEHEVTLACKHQLAYCLKTQNKFDDAQRLFQEAFEGRAKRFGKYNETLMSKHEYAQCLFSRKDYEKARSLLSQLVQEEMNYFGVESQYYLLTVSSLSLIDAIYSKQRRVQEFEMASNSNISTAKASNFSSPNLRVTSTAVNTVMLSNDGQMSPDTLDPLDLHFSGQLESRSAYTDAAILEVSELLTRKSRSWSRIPRTYIVLRWINQLQCIERFIQLGFTDYLFPVTEKSLPQFLGPSARSEFVKHQHLVLTQSMDLEKGEGGSHQHFKDNFTSFEIISRLGSGGFGQVDRVRSHISYKEYALKRVHRKASFGPSVRILRSIINEVESLKTLRHMHIVQFVGSYTDRKYFGILMSPVAEEDLASYLKRGADTNSAETRTFFGCLTAGLDHLHCAGVKHKDVKPQNILVLKGNILYTDFGLATDFADGASTTSGTIRGFSVRYCSPEVVMTERRGTSADIWSLGCVFLEIVTRLKGKEFDDMNTFFERHGSCDPFIRTNMEGFFEYLQELRKLGLSSDNRVLEWIQLMCQENRKKRPTAGELLQEINKRDRYGNFGAFCGLCCRGYDIDQSDNESIDPLDEAFGNLTLRTRS